MAKEMAQWTEHIPLIQEGQFHPQHLWVPSTMQQPPSTELGAVPKYCGVWPPNKKTDP